MTLKPMHAELLRRFMVLVFIAIFAWLLNARSLNHLSYFALIPAVLIYTFGPKTHIPEQAAYFRKIVVLDIGGFFLGTIPLFFFFMIYGESTNSKIGALTVLIVFSIMPGFILWISARLASSWYLFSDNHFQWLDKKGIHKIHQKEIVSLEPYILKKNRSIPEMGTILTTQSGKEIKIVANNLETNDVFLSHMRKLIGEHDPEFANYFETGEISEEYLEKLQKRMEKYDH